MIMYNRPDQSMAIRRKGSETAIRVCVINTVMLKKVNNKIEYFLDRIPLKDLRDVVFLNGLMGKQERLIRVHIQRYVPLIIEVFNENERYRACYLRRRFMDAHRRNKIKKSKKHIFVEVNVVE